MQLVMVCRTDEQVRVIVFPLESGGRAESISPSPQTSLVRTQRQRIVSQGIVCLVADALIEVIQHDRVFVRIKRPPPRVVSA